MEEKVLEILEEYCEEALAYTGENMRGLSTPLR